ncbi:uncharacterized protein KD926_011387 [Aspergillus affinis]|uniref:uncharacterized protein n=1 Tax=Aspergillus affinis TaxID=1070780 RepID=UPI0022FDD36F|nr:uncharacterized protein KD926_011387 [Aspergillus affinis]KAI9038049.1 hypothetical protein KD926_011387 [Aspergillus affinis]
MFCPICHPNHLYVEAPVFITSFQIHETHGTTAPDARFPSLTTFDQGQLKLAQHLSTILPHECRQSFEACRIAALKAYDGFKKLTDLHSFRYKAMCPQADVADGPNTDTNTDAGAGVEADNPGPPSDSYEPEPEQPNKPDYPDLPPVPVPFSAFALHCASIDHLLNWPVLHNQDTLTVSHPPKIPPEILSFMVNQSAYEAYMDAFQDEVDQYITGVYEGYGKAKKDLEETIWKSGIGEMNIRMWRQFWEEGFLAQNEKWEEDLRNVVLPEWDEIVDELYQAILERVEGADGMMNMLQASERKGEDGEEGVFVDDDSASFSSYDAISSVVEDIASM